ncbi:MAG TPA: DNA-3-methyladenine glycosylase I [Bacteroidia bacterium]
MEKHRCAWCGSEPVYVEYHDKEWGVPVHDDKLLFEFLVLESFQAGLSWITILRRRAHFKKAFLNFDLKKVAELTENDVDILLQNESVIRHRGKIEASIANAKAFMKVQDEFGSFDAYLWAFVDGNPIQNKVKSLKDIASKTAISDKISKDLKKRGFKFVGSTTIYAYMQAIGMVNDHIIECFRYKELGGK